VLERLVGRAADIVGRDEKLNSAGAVLNVGETRLAHYAFQHHAAGDRDLDVLCGERLTFGRVMTRMQNAGIMPALEVIRKRRAGGAQTRELGAPVGDDLVFIGRRRNQLVG